MNEISNIKKIYGAQCLSYQKGKGKLLKGLFCRSMPELARKINYFGMTAQFLS